MQLAHAFEVDDGRAVDPHELLGIELRLELRESLPHDVHRVSDVQLDVIVGGFERIDIRGIDERDLVAIAHREPAQRARVIREQCGRYSLGEPLLRARHRGE